MPKNMTLPQTSEKIGEVLQVIAPPARLAILIAIGTGEACVCHLEAALGWRFAKRIFCRTGAKAVTFFID
jgi:hypothetical protein